MSNTEQERKEVEYNYTISIQHPKAPKWGIMAWVWLTTTVVSFGTIIVGVFNPALGEWGGGWLVVGCVAVFLMCAVLMPLIPSSWGWEVNPSEVENVVEDFKKNTGWEIEHTTGQRIIQLSNRYLTAPPEDMVVLWNNRTPYVTAIAWDEKKTYSMVVDVIVPRAARRRVGDVVKLSFPATQPAAPAPF